LPSLHLTATLGVPPPAPFVTLGTSLAVVDAEVDAAPLPVPIPFIVEFAPAPAEMLVLTGPDEVGLGSESERERVTEVVLRVKEEREMLLVASMIVGNVSRLSPGGMPVSGNRRRLAMGETDLGSPDVDLERW
jgi:hypothetical protein